jgi:hypothetical protein
VKAIAMETARDKLSAPLNPRGATLLEINIRPIGNIGNRMIQYMAALKLRSLIADSIVTGADVQEWGIPLMPAVATRVHNFGFYVGNDVNFEAVAGLVRRGIVDRIEIHEYMQRMKYFLQPDFYRTIFRPMFDDYAIINNDEICINVRGGIFWRACHIIHFFQ